MSGTGPSSFPKKDKPDLRRPYLDKRICIYQGTNATDIKEHQEWVMLSTYDKHKPMTAEGTQAGVLKLQGEWMLQLTNNRTENFAVGEKIHIAYRCDNKKIVWIGRNDESQKETELFT